MAGISQRTTDHARQTFLETLRDTANVSAAARAASVNRRTVYNWRDENPDFAADWENANLEFDAVIYHGDADQLRDLCQTLAKRSGAIVSVQGFARGETNILLERLLVERSLSVNTAAAGGNASLMTIG